MNSCNSFVIFLFIVLSSLSATAQNSITLDQCQEWAQVNHPLSKQTQILDQLANINSNAANKQYLPQANIKAQATYQSEVTSLPIELPGIEVPSLSNDQYKVYGEVFQPLTASPHIRNAKKTIQSKTKIEQQQVSINLYKLREQINDIYFGILLLDAQKEVAALANADLQKASEKLKSAVSNGIATQNDLMLLQVEQLQLEQKLKELDQQREAYITVLSILTGHEITPNMQFEIPKDPSILTDNHRPELMLLDLQQNQLRLEKSYLNKKWIPAIGLFLQGGYGRPALNFLSNDFEPYYIGGVRMDWNITQLYTNKNNSEQIQLQSLLLDNQRDAFLQKTHTEITLQNMEIAKHVDQVKLGDTIVELRENIQKTSEIQLQNGIITSSDYIKTLNDTKRAREEQQIHQLQLLKTKFKLNTLTGNL